MHRWLRGNGRPCLHIPRKRTGYTRLHTCTEIVNTLNTFLPVGNRLLRHLPNTKRSSDLLKNMSHDHAINICTHTITVSPTNAPPASLEAGHSSWKEENLPPTFPTQTAV